MEEIDEMDKKNKKKYQAVIFDLDGTILDTLDDLANSLNACLAMHGFPARTIQEVRRFVGNGIHKLVERGVPEGTDSAKIEAVFADFRVYYKQHCDDMTKPYDGIMRLLKQLREDGYQLAVVSNKADEAVQILCEQYFHGIFAVTVGEREDVKKKPAPDSVYAVLQELGIEKSQAVYVGDSEVDIETARNAGMNCISVSWGFRDTEELLANGASDVIAAPKEIYERI